MTDQEPGGGKEARQERQAKALRENLARRKAQSRARAARSRGDTGEETRKDDSAD